MKNRYFGLSGDCLLLVCAAFGQEVREAVWAGQFYDSDAGQLAAQIDRFLRNVPPQPESGERSRP